MTLAADFAADSTIETLFALRGTSTRRLASDCHEAARAFVEESPFWGKAELAMWLLGPYSQVAQDLREGPPRSRPSLREIDAITIDGVMACARAEVLDALDRLETPETASDVAFSMITAGFVVETVDANGVPGWVPTTRARRLADRVLTLFVAAFLSQVVVDSVRLAA